VLMKNMDESLDIKPTVTIEGKQVELLKINAAFVGQKFELCSTATISDIQQYMRSDGIVDNRITLTLTSLTLEDPERDLTSMYNKSPSPTAKGRK